VNKTTSKQMPASHPIITWYITILVSSDYGLIKIWDYKASTIIENACNS